ncbi:hypothetical protein MTR67_003649 [Solanum verrucosum]|uniref:MBD domain-containing protein n=1 Tax=Solanum verrucosum TaxID=315347 RepID=A0AAF0PYG4_SOLVR|nr:hypothetical protein MTR67_003649 [Solanum verrucosum]
MNFWTSSSTTKSNILSVLYYVEWFVDTVVLGNDTPEKYEEIREHNLERPFYCEITREWHSNKKCDDPPDVTEDESGLKWAIDAPNIPQPPPGWECLIKFRTNRVSRYYKRSSPSEKTTLRSSIEVEKYLEQHPEDATQSAKLDNFSFQIPRSLEEDYVVNGGTNLY